MHFLRRRLVRGLLALILAGTGFCVTRSFDAWDDASAVWPVVLRSQSEFERVAKAIKGVPAGGSRADSEQRRGLNNTSGNDKTERAGEVEPKVIEIEYDGAGNAIGTDAVGSQEGQDGGLPRDHMGVSQHGAGNANQSRTAFHAPGTVPYENAKQHYALDLPVAWQEMSAGELNQINHSA